MERSPGLSADPVFLGLTRPPMLLGVTYIGLLLNVVITMEVFITTKNLLWLLAFAPIHGLMWILCLYEPRIFELLQLWGRTRGLNLLAGNKRHWHAGSYSPLALELPDQRRRRAAVPHLR